MTNLADELRSVAARTPDKPALLCAGREITYGDLNRSVDRGAAGLSALGLRAGDRVGLLLGNTAHFVEVLYSVWRAGLVAVPLNTTLTTGEVAEVLVDSEARVVVAAQPFAATLAGLRQTLPAFEHVVVAGASNPPVGARTWRQLTNVAASQATAAVSEDRPTAAASDEQLLALVQYTSGTTGKPKGAMLTHANLSANHHQINRTRLALRAGDVVLCALPLFHIYALNAGLAMALSAGATALVLERFDPVTSLEAIARHRVTVILGAPPMYIAWLNTPGAQQYDLGSVRMAISGAAPLRADVLRRFSEQFGVAIWEGYGLSESAPVLTTTAIGGEARPHSVGRPLPGVELRLIDERGVQVAAGDPGEVIARGPNIFAGYWNAVEATRAALDGDGWLHTGDIGYFQDDDLYLIDRKSDLIIVSGFNVYPGQVEDVLEAHPKVARAAVVGMPHPYTGECIKAAVVMAAGEEATAEELIAYCRESLAGFKCPATVEFLPELPQLDSGKVSRRSLREGIAAAGR